MTVTPVITIGETALRRRAPRLAGDMRRALIIEAACRFFAEHGFSGPTRDLAASIGVTQALLYRYFDSKTDLIDAVFASVFKGEWGADALRRFEQTEGLAMVDRLVEVYETLLPHMTGIATRLLFRAGLDAYAGPVCRNAGLDASLRAALVESWRREEGLPSLGVLPMLAGERALIDAMHDAMLAIRVREHILHVARTLDDADEIRQVAETQDAAIRVVLRRLHAGQASLGRTAPVATEELVAA